MRKCYNLAISNIPEISAIYFALLQHGYDYYAIEQSIEHGNAIRGFIGTDVVPSFFSLVRQSTCEVYPYWPRAAMLESAVFYLLPDHSQFRDYNAFREHILSAHNIADHERDCLFWSWVEEFPASLSKVLESDGFQRYLEWENKWIASQNALYEAELRQIQKCIEVCVSKYGSPVDAIEIVMNPIKCVYSSDYHMDGNCFVFSSGAFREESVIHEFLHHVLHPVVMELEKEILANRRRYADIDVSYYLSGDNAGQLNAFEEYAVRRLTGVVMDEHYPDELIPFLYDLIVYE